MNLIFATETVEQVKPDIIELLKLHYEELALHKTIVLAPDWAKYQMLEDASKLMVYTVRDGFKLIGYSVWFIDCNIHYSNDLFANSDVIFLHKDYRNKHTLWTIALSTVRRYLGCRPSNGAGKQLIQYSEDQLKLIKVNKVLFHVKFKLDWSPILIRRGYQREDFIVSKIL